MFNDSLTVAIPLYNESATIPYLKSRLDLMLEKSNHNNLKILFVDDGSSDDTFQLLTDNFSSFDNCSFLVDSVSLCCFSLAEVASLLQISIRRWFGYKFFILLIISVKFSTLDMPDDMFL